MTQLPFIKMDGIGNTFVVVDLRLSEVKPKFTKPFLRQASYPNHSDTEGCDQFVVIEPSDKADAFMRIYNSDGSASAACGNATRCVAHILVKAELHNNDHVDVTIDSEAGLLKARVYDEQRVVIDMGKARTIWNEIPLSKEQDTNCLDFELGSLKDPVATSLGNPHVTFFVQHINNVDLEKFGPMIENDKLFPERVNVGLAHVKGEHIKLRVWERGVGETQACGTGACAAFSAAVRRGYVTGAKSVVHLPGGRLTLSLDDNEHIIMEGPVNYQFEGSLVLPKA